MPYVGLAPALFLAVGVEDCIGVTVVAADDVTAEYSRELTFAGDTILAWEQNGETLTTDPPLRMVPKQGTNNQSVRAAAKVIVNP